MERPLQNLFWLTLLPGIGFWAHLVLWFMDWSVPKPAGSGENWFPMMIQLGLFCLSAAAGSLFLTIAVIQTIRRHTSWHWWLTAVVNLAPAVVWFSVYIPIQLFQSERLEV